jgi:uncharacterized membrane protein (UPF0182 family)
MKRRTQLALWVIVVGLIVLLSFFSRAMGFVQKWLWMKQLDYSVIFWKIFSIKWTLFGIAFGCVLLAFWLSLRVVATMVPTAATAERSDTQVLSSGNGSYVDPIYPADVLA